MSPCINCPYCFYPLLIDSTSGKPYWFCHHCHQSVSCGVDRTPTAHQPEGSRPCEQGKASGELTLERMAELIQQKQTALKLEFAKLSQLKEDFLNTTSHELRTPLSNMKLAIQLLETLLRQKGVLAPEQDDPDTAPAQISDYLNVLSHECEQEISLINDLLALQHLEAGTQMLLPMQLPLHDWLLQMVVPFEAKISRRQQQLHLDLPSDLPRLTTDFTLLDRLLSELLNNASKFSPKGECITLTAVALAGRIQIQIINTGIEISESELTQIFDKFYRIPIDNPWRHSGTGLGLALAKALALYLGGAIAVEGQSGQTCFTVELPCQESQVITPKDMLMSYVAYYLGLGKTVYSPRQGLLPFEGEVYQYCGYHRDFLDFWHRLLQRRDFPELHLQGDSHAFRQFLAGDFTVTECARCRLPIAAAEGHVPSTPNCELCPEPKSLESKYAFLNQHPQLQPKAIQVLVIGTRSTFDTALQDSLATNGFEVTVIPDVEPHSLAMLPLTVDLVLIHADISGSTAEEWATLLSGYPQLEGVQIVALSSQNRLSLPWSAHQLTVADYLLSPLGGDRLADHLAQVASHQSANRPLPLHWFPQ